MGLWSFAFITGLLIGRNDLFNAKTKRVVGAIKQHRGYPDKNIKFVVVLSDISETSKHFSFDNPWKKTRDARIILDKLEDVPYIPLLGNHYLGRTCLKHESFLVSKYFIHVFGP